MSPQLERFAVLLALALLVVATIVRFAPRTPAPLRHRAGIGLLAAVSLVLAVAIAGRWVREGQGPFLTMYDVLLSNVFSLALIHVLVTGRSAVLRETANIAIPLLLLLCAWLALAPPEAVPLPATFDNHWLWVHVLSGKLFLGLCMVSAAAAVLQLLAPREQLTGSESPIWSMYFMVFIFHSIMLVSGSAWAHSAWGRFWSWDGLEISTLVTWLLIGGTLHARATFRNMPERALLSLVVASFVLALLTFFGVPFLSFGPHKGFV